MARIKGPTAAELIEKLRADPDWVAAEKTRARLHAERVEVSRLEEKPLLDDLAAIGLSVDSVSRLLGIPNPDQRIYPILLEHLSRSYSPMHLEWIGRSFGRKSARPIVWDTLVSGLKSHTIDGPAADGVMTAISEMALPGDLGTLIDLLADRSLGVRRIFLVSNLMRSKKPEARTALLRLQNDADLHKEISARLKTSRV